MSLLKNKCNPEICIPAQGCRSPHVAPRQCSIFKYLFLSAENSSRAHFPIPIHMKNALTVARGWSITQITRQQNQQCGFPRNVTPTPPASLETHLTNNSRGMESNVAWILQAVLLVFIIICSKQSAPVHCVWGEMLSNPKQEPKSNFLGMPAKCSKADNPVSVR